MEGEGGGSGEGRREAGREETREAGRKQLRKGGTEGEREGGTSGSTRQHGLTPASSAQPSALCFRFARLHFRSQPSRSRPPPNQGKGGREATAKKARVKGKEGKTQEKEGLGREQK